MYQLINDILLKFLPDFKRTKTWRWFVVMVIGFMIRNNHNGITSIISSLRLKPSLYHTALHFFRSRGYTTEALYKRWIQIAVKESSVQRVGKRVLLLGDHIKISKEGRRMPDIQIHHQESQNSGKSEFIEGHIYGHVSTVITNGTTSRSLPLISELQKSPLKEKGSKKAIGDSLVVQMINLVSEAAKSINQPVIVALDSYFCKGKAFVCAEGKLTESGETLVDIVTRGKSNMVAYKTPETLTEKKRGRPRKYGEKIVLSELFSDVSSFKQVSLNIYGKKTRVKYLCMDLLWKPAKKLLRFVLLESKIGCCILVSSNITLTPEEIITAYAFRFKIEISFDEQKNDVGCFCYRFWTMSQPKRKKWKKNDEDSNNSRNKNIERAQAATSTFVCISTISVGIMTIISFTHSNEIWERYPGWLRTLRSAIPTIATVRETIAQDFHAILNTSSRFMGFNFIKPLIRYIDFLYADFADACDELA